MSLLSPSEQKRYARHLVLPGFGQEGQLKLKAAKVLVIGAGGLGAPLLLYLAAAGVGKIGIIDPDRVEMHNLQRQILYTMDDIGLPKVEAASARLLALNPEVDIEVYPYAFNSDNALAIIAAYDLVADGTDNFPTRYLINDACVLADKVNVHAAIFRFEGQLTVFNAPLADGSRSPNYRDLFPSPPPAGSVPDCAEGGVLGVLPGLLGTLQATEVIKIICGIGEPLVGQLLMIDTTDMRQRRLRYKTRSDYQIKELIDYEVFCGVDTQPIPSLDYAQIKLWKERGKVFELVDVRTDRERAQGHIGGIHIPIQDLAQRLDELPKQSVLVFYCQSGQRSAQAIRLLQDQADDLATIFHLEGGLQAIRIDS